MNTGLEIGKGLPFGMKNLWSKEGKPNWELIEIQDWFIDLQNCPQDPTFHAEGDVGIHTKMVVNALMNLEEFQALNAYDQQILSWSALLHDIGKPRCTMTDEEGFIRAPKHANIGEKMARRILWDMDFKAREAICALIRLHSLPIWCLDKQNPNAAVASASLRLTNKHLYLLSKADVLGRESISQDDFLERIAFFKAFAIEQECWEQAKPFHNRHSRFKFFHKASSYPAVIYDDTAFEVILLSGIPGSGKDTYAKTQKLPMISLDAIRAELKIKVTDKNGQGEVVQLAYKRAKEFAAKKQSFVWNSTNLTNELRTRLVRTLSVYNPRFKLVYIETSRANILARRRATIPIRKLEKMINMLEMPLPNEVHSIEYMRN
ncbi:MAG: Metal dependent phosphohydrolase [uncultured Aureispira sp.]|uniref:Metal dependent phosphohydrolase n=1 Tax=uncultured Aureispira sp. TaxID=1331704 RepID=A0A6S6U2E3_9BACT|nr:MAG: Metal dependent phosphohydrolase [uncultured Aureispira sp.]